MTDDRRSDIALIGLWHLGSVSAAAWTTLGLRVVGWDPDSGLREALCRGEAPVSEPGIDQALAAALSLKTFSIAPKADAAIAGAAVTHIAFDTQLGSSSLPDDPRLDKAVESFVRAAPDGALLLVSSQVPAGTCRGWKALLDAEQRGLLIAHVPENLRLGSSLDDFLHPPRLLVGADEDEAFDRAAALLAPLGTTPIRLGLSSAEMAKHATNAYLALCIAFANDLAWVSRFVGADPTEVTEALRADPRVSPTAPLRPGTAFSGATLIRDLATLRSLGEEAGRPALFAAVIETNEQHATLALAWLEESLGGLAGKHGAVAGLTSKPGTSTLRDSLPLRIVGDILERGATVAAWDPSAEAFGPRDGLTRSPTLAASLEGADCLVVLTALPEIRTADWAALQPGSGIVVDACGGVDRKAAEAAGWSYRGLDG